MFVSERGCRALGRAQTLDTDVMLASILKGTSEKQGISVFRSLGFGALNFPVSHRDIPNFRAAFASDTVPSLCSMFLYCILLHHISRKPETSCNSLAYTKIPLHLFNFLVFFLLCTNAAWRARLNQVSQHSVFWSQGKLPRRGSEITGVPPKPLPTSCSGRADANKSLTTTPLSLMDLAPGHTA